MNRNVQGTSLEVPDMVLLVKYHKEFMPGMSGVIPTRPVVSRSRGINTHLSEGLSEVSEPVADSMGSGEIASTEEAVHHLDRINDDVRANTDTPHDDVLLPISNKDEADHLLQLKTNSYWLTQTFSSLNLKKRKNHGRFKFGCFYSQITD